MIHQLIQEARETLRLPNIQGERCVHSLIEQGSCRRCVTVCPTTAWVVDDEQVGIQPDLCDGCGLCAAVCPEGAIEHEIRPEVGYWNGRAIAMIACDRTESIYPEESIVPCLNALGVHQLLTLYQQGCRYFFVQTGNCHQCDRETEATFSHTTDQINTMLTGQGLPPLVIKSPNKRQWHRVRDKLITTPPATMLDRRHFFRNATARLLETGLKREDNGKADEFTAPGAMIPVSNKTGSVFPFVPSVDIKRCTGCNACIRSCPHQAITFQDAGESDAFYFIHSELCTGCDICSDVCAEDAITVTHWNTCDVTKIPLIKSRCQSCGIPMNKPKFSTQDYSLCHICGQHNHWKNLFQVLE